MNYVVLEKVGMSATATRTPWQSFKAWAQSLRGARQFHFLPLYVEPALCSAVMLSCEGKVREVTVNGQKVEANPLSEGCYLLPSDSFVRWENTLSLESSILNPQLFPLFDKPPSWKNLELPTASSWRLTGLNGKEFDTLSEPIKEPGIAKGLKALSHSLLPFVISEGDSKGDVWSFYDLEDQSFRLAAWRWDTAIVLEALAAAATHLKDPKLMDAARIVGDRLLEVQLETPDCLGGTPEWVDFRYSESNREVTEWVAPFNAGFVGAALARLGEATGEDVYLEGARCTLDCAVEKGLTPKGGVKGYYLPISDDWSYLGQINDSGILPRGLAALSDLNPAVDYREVSRRVAGYVIEKAACDDGHFGRAWHDPVGAYSCGDPLFPEWKKFPDRLVPKIFLRGQAWVLFGLTASWRLTEDGSILEKAEKLVDYLLEVQQEDGSWLYSQLQPDFGPCAKGTAAIALALAEHIRDTGNSKSLDAIRKAFEYLDTVRSGESGPADLSPAPVDSSEEGCIIYFRNRSVICAYAGALELLARIQIENLEGAGAI